MLQKMNFTILFSKKKQKQNMYFIKSIGVTFSERKHLMWRDELMEGIFFIWELKDRK